MKTRFLLLLAVLIAGFGLRVFALGSRPSGITWDEAALGYNAYSLYLTGRDEYGRTTPVIFKSFGDYKPGLYIYFTVPSVAIFGLNEFAARLPSAVFGTLLLVVIYVLARLLFPRDPGIWVGSLIVGAINPWAIQFSRGAWEANLALLLTTLGVTIFIANLKRMSLIYYLVSIFFFGLTFWSYQGAKLFTPLIFISTIVIYRRYLKFNVKSVFLYFSLFFVFLIPVLWNLGSQSGRLQVFSVFSYTRSQAYIREILSQDHTAGKNWIYYLYHSEFLDQARGVLQRYLNHFSGRFIFSEGDWTSLRHSLYGYGYFHLPDIICLVLGFFFILSRINRSV
jgi:4-amino-4-deoxy-L-arabinose transferase-like glycosyltransferase